jgi:uncharacterized protein
MESCKMSIIQAIQRAARAAAVAVALAAVITPAHAQQPSASSIQVAKQLIAATGATTIFNPLIAGVVEQAKILFLQQNPALGKDLNEVAAQIRTEMQPRFSEITDEVAKLYASNFTEQEMKDILTFYQSPAGKKLLAAQGKVIESSMAFAQTWANNLSDQVIAKMRDEMKKRGHPL